MITQIKSEFLAILFNNVFQTFEKEPDPNSCDFVIKNAKGSIQENGIFAVSGQEIIWEYAKNKALVSELKEKPEKKYIKYGYLSLIDLILLRKKAYVTGWYKLQNTKEFKLLTNNWTLIN